MVTSGPHLHVGHTSQNGRVKVTPKPRRSRGIVSPAGCCCFQSGQQCHRCCC